ncbi:MAG: hypothetical protein ABII85_02305 [Bacillota bacterium]
MMNQILSEDTFKAFSDSIKIGLVATIDDQMEPHITVLATLQGKDKKTMMLGKFVEGLSKQFIQDRPKTGFLIMNPQKEFWYGKMNYTHLLKDGDDYIMYNNQPLYRYNTYFGINTVYYFDLVEISDKFILPMGSIIKNAIKVVLRKKKFIDKQNQNVMKPWASKFTSKMDTLKFLAYIDKSGYPQIIPVIQGQSVGSSRFVITNEPYKERLNTLEKGQKIAIFAFSMTMESVLLKGTFSGFQDTRYGYLDIERVYNSMPPVHGYIYPETPRDEVLFSENDNVLNSI